MSGTNQAFVTQAPRATSSGVTWVFLRGLGREAGHWSQLPQNLAAAVPGIKVLTPDMPGTGSLNTLPSPMSVPAIAQAVRASVLSQTTQTRMYLVGLSLGSMVALSWAQQFSAEVAGLVLISASAAGVCPPWWRLKPGALPGFVKVAWARNGRDREALILRLTAANAEAQEAALQPWTSIAKQRPVARANLARQLLAATAFKPRLEPLTIPSLVLAGAGDQMVDPRCSQRLGAMLGAKVSIHPTAGHDLPLDDPEWLLEQLAGWAKTQNVTKEK